MPISYKRKYSMKKSKSSKGSKSSKLSKRVKTRKSTKTKKRLTRKSKNVSVVRKMRGGEYEEVKELIIMIAEHSYRDDDDKEDMIRQITSLLPDSVTNITQFWDFFLTRQFKKKLLRALPLGYIVKLRVYYKTYINPNYQQPSANNNVDA